MIDVRGRTVIVTGAGGGIGEGMALALGNAGANVVVAARRAETGDPVAEEIRRRGGSAKCIVTDVSNRESVDALVAKTVELYGGLECMIHNAISGRSPDDRPALDVDEDLLDDIMGVAVRGSFYCVQAAIPYLKPGDGSIILMIAHGGVRGHPTLAAYTPVKGMQRGLLKSLAWELGPRRINVNSIIPFASTPAMKAYQKARPNDPSVSGKGRVVLGYIGDAELDVGGAAVFLASKAAQYITGQSFFVDGGSLLL